MTEYQLQKKSKITCFINEQFCFVQLAWL